MDYGSAYDDLLASAVCPICGHEGLLPNGTGWCECENEDCNWEGPIPGWEEDEDDDEEDEDDED